MQFQDKRGGLNFRDVIEIAAVAVLMALFLKTFVLDFFIIPSNSMKPALKKGDIVFTARVSYFFGLPDILPFLNFHTPNRAKVHFRKPEIGEVAMVAVKSGQTGHSRLNVKRITAVPGTDIFFNNAKQNLKFSSGYSEEYSKDFPLPAAGDTVRLTYLNMLFYRSLMEKEGAELRIKSGKIHVNGIPQSLYVFRENYYFLEGDNSSTSIDSRYYGPLPGSALQGRVMFVVLPGDRDNSRAGLIK